MKFGILYNTDYYPEVHGSASQYYNLILEQVQLEEELGFDSVWFGEHHYSGYSFGSPPVMAMAAAARTKRIRLGTGVSLIPLNHPIRLAEEYAMLDVLSGGRLEYGIGRGFLKYSHEIFGVNEDENHERYHEGTEIILKAWTAEGPFSYQGKFWTLQDYTFFPKALKEANYNPGEKDVAGVYQLYCGESNEEAHRHGGGHVLNYYKFFGTLDHRSPHTSRAFAHYKGGVSRLFAGVTYEDLDRRNLIMIGDPENLLARIRWAQEFYGTNYLIFEVAQGGMPHKYVMPSLERFAKYVMPAFRDKQ